MLLASLMRAGLSLSDAVSRAGLQRDRPAQGTPEALLRDVWTFVLDTGAAPAAVLEVCAESFAAAAENARAARVQMAGPQAATRLVMGLPLLAIAGGIVAGYNPLAFLCGTVLGWVTLVVAGGLMLIAHRWSQSMLSKAQLSSWSAGMALEAMAMSLSAGQSLATSEAWAKNLAQSYLGPEHGIQELKECSSLAQLSRSTGVALVGLLRDRAKQARLASRENAQIRVEKLAVQLMIPLGVCVLPAFIAVGVLPIVATMISSTALNS